jgi:hypothetical protein
VVLLVDEVSLVSCELMSELYSALHFVKEKPDQWFGGIMVIFAGEFYQYPPVGGTPLSTHISAYAGQSDDEINKRLGQLVWKSINSVVTLTVQECMKKMTLNMQLLYSNSKSESAHWKMFNFSIAVW